MKKLLFSLCIAAALALADTAVLAAPVTVTLDVPGMTCPLCPITVRKALERVDGVLNVKVSFDRKEAVVIFDDARTTIQALTRSTADAGYVSTVKE
jgi:mercuric ion binding protein